MAEKSAPVRRCAGCGAHGEKSSFVRILREPDGNVTVDLTGKKNGRGVYLCLDEKCIAKAKKSRRPDKSIKTPVPDEVYDELIRLAREASDGRA